MVHALRTSPLLALCKTKSLHHAELEQVTNSLIHSLTHPPTHSPLSVFALNIWRTSPSFERGSRAANWLLVVAGIGLTGYQLAGWASS